MSWPILLYAVAFGAVLSQLLSASAYGIGVAVRRRRKSRKTSLVQFESGETLGANVSLANSADIGDRQDLSPATLEADPDPARADMQGDADEEVLQAGSGVDSLGRPSPRRESADGAELELARDSRALAIRRGVSDHPRALPPSLAWLRAVRGVGGEYMLSHQHNSIGRNADCDIVLQSERVSRRHCVISSESGVWRLYALETSNGCFVNGKVVEPLTSTALRTGDTIGIGVSIELELFAPSLTQWSRLQFSTGAATHVGRRKTNQDDYLADHYLVAVADGVGGRPAGKVAAGIAVRAVQERGRNQDLAQTFARANLELRSLGLRDPQVAGLATTLDAVMLRDRDGEFVVEGFHVGDSQSVLVERGSIEYLTRAHTLGEELVLAGRRLSETPSQLAPERAQLLRAVGLDDVVSPDNWSREAREGQRYILCTDGLTAALGKHKFETVVRDALDLGPDVCADMLVEAALEARASDNVTVVVADVSAET